MLPLLTPYHFDKLTKSSFTSFSSLFPADELMQFFFVSRSSWLKFISKFISLLQGGEVVQETITSNIHDDIIMLEFQRTDGTLITQLIDFRSVSSSF